MSRKPTAARVTVNETPAAEDAAGGIRAPSAELIADGKKQVRLSPDPRGRVITLAKPGVLAQFRLVKMMGAAASNQAYMSMILPILFVTGIDGDPVHAPTSEREIEALIQRLDEDGVSHVAVGVMKHYNGAVIDPTTGQMRAMTAEEQLEASKEVIKKS